MNNEAILNKLVELGYVQELDYQVPEHRGFYFIGTSLYLFTDSVGKQPFIDGSNYHLALQDALIAECGKRGYDIRISTINGIGTLLAIVDYNGDVYESDIFEAPYSRQAIIEAFCKVTGVECDT